MKEMVIHAGKGGGGALCACPLVWLRGKWLLLAFHMSEYCLPRILGCIIQNREQEIDGSSSKVIEVFLSLTYLAQSRLIPNGGGVNGMVSCLLHILQCPFTCQQTGEFPSAGMNGTVTGGGEGALSCTFCKWNRNAMTGSGMWISSTSEYVAGIATLILVYGVMLWLYFCCCSTGPHDDILLGANFFV